MSEPLVEVRHLKQYFPVRSGMKTQMLKAVDDQAKTNGYWLRQINRLRTWGIDTYTDYKKTVEAQTPASVAAYMKELLKPGNRAEVIMLPEE